ncbi:MAG: Peptide methionine sulfoxide reductase MsrA [Frankiales bacterium]|nr:Peptide methionine sulfoxide reductase MsrA [Frankiales bacterium]
MRFFSKPAMPTPETALPGRDTPVAVPAQHAVLGTRMTPPFPAGSEQLYVGMGCFWGAERIFWQVPGVITTAAGYTGGYTPNPSYEQTCTGRTGHTEAVLVVYDPARVDVEVLLKAFWENHDPTQEDGQGNDHGTQYRTAVYPTTAAQAAAVTASQQRYQAALTAAGFGRITTEVRPFSEAGPFYYAEAHHQQYLHKNPGGYCNHGFCQVAYDRQDPTRVELPAG